MDLNELCEGMNELRSDDVVFYAHLTEEDKGTMINDNGIILDSNRLFSAVNLIEDSFYDDIEDYINTKLGSPQTRKKDLMVIVALLDGEENTIVKKYKDGYLIPSENIVGYIDLHSNSFISNKNSDYSINSYSL